MDFNFIISYEKLTNYKTLTLINIITIILSKMLNKYLDIKLFGKYCYWRASNIAEDLCEKFWKTRNVFQAVNKTFVK